METHGDKVARLQVIVAADQPLPPDLGAWVCSIAQEHARVRELALPSAATKHLRDSRIIAAADAAGAMTTWAVALALHDESKRLARTWARTKYYDLAPGTCAGELHAAMRWHPLPDSSRTFFRVLTRGP